MFPQRFCLLKLVRIFLSGQWLLHKSTYLDTEVDHLIQVCEKKVQNSRDDYKRFDYILPPELEKKIKKLVKIWIWADFKEKKKNTIIYVKLVG